MGNIIFKCTVRNIADTHSKDFYLSRELSIKFSKHITIKEKVIYNPTIKQHSFNDIKHFINCDNY